MPRIPLPKQSYQLASLPASAQRLVNCYVELTPEDARSPFIIKPTPGLVPRYLIGAGPIYAMASMPGRMYFVSGSEAIRVSPHPITGVMENVWLGDVGVTALPTIAIGPTQVVFVNPPNVWVASHTGLLQGVSGTGGNFPGNGASSVVYIDGYFVFTAYDGSRFFCSDLLDATSYQGLDFATSENRPDYVQFSAVLRNEIWLFGQASIAVFYDAGGASFPFAPRTGAVLEQACGSNASIAQTDGSLFWLGRDRIVYRSQGYQAQRISTHAIEEVLQKYGDLRDITGFEFIFEGHACYALAVPSAPDSGTTYVYDCATRLWHERRSGADGTNRWRGNRSCILGVELFIGDSISGNIFEMKISADSDAYLPLTRIITFPPLFAGAHRAFMDRLEVEIGVGETAGNVILDWSDDGGHTWGPRRTLGLGLINEWRKRVFTTRLGSYRQRVLRLTSNRAITVYGADVEGIGGAA